MQNLDCLLRDLEAIKAKDQPNLHILGIIINRVDLRRNLSKKMLAAYRYTLGDAVFESYISNDTAISNSIDRKMPLRLLNWQSRIVKQLNSIIDEMLKRMGLKDAE
jgi:chromosome partitioning protein